MNSPAYYARWRCEPQRSGQVATGHSSPYYAWLHMLSRLHQGNLAVVLPGAGFCRCARCQPSRHDRLLEDLARHQKALDFQAKYKLAKSAPLMQPVLASSSAEPNLPSLKTG